MRDYKELIGTELSNVLNISFKAEVLDKIDKYIENPLDNDNIDLIKLEDAFNNFFTNTRNDDLTYNLTDSQLYNEALIAANTEVTETKKKLAETAATTAQGAAASPAGAAAPPATYDRAAADEANEKLEYLKNTHNNIKAIKAPKYLKTLFPDYAKYKDLTDLFNNFDITEPIKISRKNEESNIVELIDNLKSEINLKYKDKFNTFKRNLQYIKDAIKEIPQIYHPPRWAAYQNSQVNIDHLEPIIQDMERIMKHVNALNNDFNLNYVDDFKEKFNKYHEIIKKKNFKNISSVNTTSIVGELKSIIDKANAENTSLSKHDIDFIEMAQVTSLVNDINSLEQKLPNPNITPEARKEIYDKISDLICQIIILFTRDDAESIKVQLPNNKTEIDLIKKLARTFNVLKFKFDPNKNDIKGERSTNLSPEEDFMTDFIFTLKNNDLQGTNFKNSKQLMEFFKIKWNDSYSTDYLECIEKIIEKNINTYTDQLKEFFNETKDNFKNIFFDLIINTTGTSVDYLVNLQNIKYNWSNIIENLKHKDKLMEVLEEPTTNDHNSSSNLGAGQFYKAFDHVAHENAINDSNKDIAGYQSIIKTIKSLIYFLFHKIGNKINETIKQVSNAPSIDKNKKKFGYNDGLFNPKLKIIVDNFLNENVDFNAMKDNGETIFFINDCKNDDFAKNLTNKDYYIKKQETKKLLNTHKQYIDESFYKILDETIEYLISIQDNILIESDALNNMKSTIKISGERFLKKYNLVGDIGINLNGIDDDTKTIEGKKVEINSPNPNPELKKFHDDNNLFTIIIDLLFISSDVRRTGIHRYVSKSNIRDKERSDFFTGGGRVAAPAPAPAAAPAVAPAVAPAAAPAVAPAEAAERVAAEAERVETNSESDEEYKQLGGRIDESISNVENTYNMIGGLKLDINPKFIRSFGFKDRHERARNYRSDPVAVNNFIMYFLEITFGLQLLLKKLFSGYDINQILTDFFSLYVKKLYKVLKPNIYSANTKLPFIVSNYSIYEITRKVIFGCFEKFVKEKILNSDTSGSANSSELDLSKDIILAKLSFSLPQLVDFFVDSFTNLDNLDNNILKPGSNNALINYYNLKLGNIFNTTVEQKENLAVISDELTKIFKVTDQDKKEINYLKFYREKIHKIDTLINNHKDETFGLLIEKIQDIIPGFEIKSDGILFGSKDFEGLTIDTKQSDLERRKEELQKELAEIESRLSYAKTSE